MRPRGDLGQNFLIDLNLLESVVAHADLGPADVVLEVGAGTGGMTTFLAEKAGFVVSVEYDSNMHTLATEALSGFSNVRLIHCDALKNKNQLNPLVTEAISEALNASPGRKLKLVANLPYHVGTPVIANLLASDYPWSRMVVTIQYELAQRLNAKPRSSDYSSLSVFVQSLSDVTLIHKLGPSVFWPRPQVDSAVVRIDPNPEAAGRILDRQALQNFLRDVFTQRRKHLRGVIAQVYKGNVSKPQIDSLFGEMQISPESRAEELEVVQLVELSNRLYQLQQNMVGEKLAT